ncbi:MAG: c-type cytochrome [Planctomycetota bacterium]|nr:c-type cytochrome [Planctomycetota bacterium]MSR38861.1 c-type cytochrome [Planctomycetota bacterium]
MSRIALTFALALLCACGKNQSPAIAKDPFAPPLGLDGPALIVDASDPITEEKVALGRILFFDPRLSATSKMSCATCHPPEKSWVDGEALSAKFDGTKNTRNTPSVMNVGYLEKLYWDGRAPTLEKNIVAAWKNQMGGKPDEVAKSLQAVPAYQAMFKKAFAAPASEDTIGRALGAFLRTLRTGNSAFDRFITRQEPTALTADQQAGFALYNGKAGCVVCHQPSLFTDRGFHNAGIGMDAAKPDPGAGGEKARNDAKFIGAFKTPTLRNVSRTAPYFHDGSVASLREAVKLMASGGKDNPNKDPLLLDRKLSDQEIDQLVLFLQSLDGTDAFTRPSVPQ